MAFNRNNDYNEVADRIREFREKHPEGSLQQVDVKFIEFDGRCWIVYTAAAYRTPTDPRPGIGTAWELVPGKTNFTRDSELQNAETAAWGRAMVAALAVDSKKIASLDEVLKSEAANRVKFDNVKIDVAGAKTLEELSELWSVALESGQSAELKDEFSKRKKELQGT
jgi:hypothetical protein